MLKIATGISVLIVCVVTAYGLITEHMSDRIIGATAFAIIVIYMTFLSIMVKVDDKRAGGSRGSTGRKKDIITTGSDGGTSGGCGDGGC